MSFIHHCSGKGLRILLLGAFLAAGSVHAQDYSSMGISDVIGNADRMLQRGDYNGAIPALNEVIRRAKDMSDPKMIETVQTCRYQLARAYYQTSDIPAGMRVLEDYLAKEPRKMEKNALRMMAQGFFEVQEWEKIEELANRLLSLPDLEPEDLFNANLLLGQSYYQQQKWAESVKPLSYAANNTKEERIKSLCEIMIVRSLVESENWPELFVWIPRIYRTDSKYDISLNLTLMKAGKARYDEAGRTDDKIDYLNALMLYRMVLPREELLNFANNRIRSLTSKLESDMKIGIKQSVADERKADIEKIKESMKTLDDLPPYEEEVTFRIGQIYKDVKRYWEGYVLFDKLYRQDRLSDIGEAAMLQSVLILYEVNEIDRAEERILVYLEEQPQGQYARTLLSMMQRDNLIKQNFDKVVDLLKYIDTLPATTDQDELSLQADLHYMGAFGYFQKKEFKLAGDQFSIILEKYPNSTHFSDSRYFRGMTFMLQGDYANALTDFVTYQDKFGSGEHYAASMFREAVSLFGLERVVESEKTFTKFIDTFPEDPLVSEAHSMRGDIEAAKDGQDNPETPEDEYDPHTLDRALADYRMAIDKATTALQASYPAFQAAKVFKLEFKWQEIIDLMNYYMDRWEEMADVAEAVYWIGQSQIELDQVGEAVIAYVDAIERFGNDPEQQGVDKIIYELLNVANHHLEEEARDDLLSTLERKLTNVDERMEVLKLRLQVAQALLLGDEASSTLGAELNAAGTDLAITTPVALALMCDAAVDSANVEEMRRLYDYFLATYEESDLLWHAYRAKTHELLIAGDLQGVLAIIDEAQGLFGAESYMGWAQLIKADTLFKRKEYELAEEAYNMVLGVAEWRGPIFAEAMYGMGQCRLAQADLKAAHSFFQRTYLLFKSYANGDWAAKGYLSAATTLVELGRNEDAVKTLNAMLEDQYTSSNPLAQEGRELLKKYGGL